MSETIAIGHMTISGLLKTNHSVKSISGSTTNNVVKSATVMKIITNELPLPGTEQDISINTIAIK